MCIRDSGKAYLRRDRNTMQRRAKVDRAEFWEVRVNTKGWRGISGSKEAVRQSF